MINALGLSQSLIVDPEAVPLGSENTVYARIGTCTQEFGGLTTWLIYALNVLTGNLDREGGAMFPHPAIDVIGMAAGHPLSRGSFDTFRSRQSQLPEFLGELPVAANAAEPQWQGAQVVRQLARCVAVKEFRLSTPVDPISSVATKYFP